MRRSYLTFVLLLCILLLAQPLTANAITSREAKQAWYEAKETSSDAQAAHRQTKVAYAADKTPENEQRVIDTGKDALHAALDEAEAWLVWKDLEVEENPEAYAILERVHWEPSDMASIMREINRGMGEVGPRQSGWRATPMSSPGGPVRPENPIFHSSSDFFFILASIRSHFLDRTSMSFSSSTACFSSGASFSGIHSGRSFP
ncbi:MAG: hypothetical protein RQ758_02100 [Methanomicrobiaceae archaeon]|nr:hypothetical protein [Methanomicrobiaceae archaeon]